MKITTLIDNLTGKAIRAPSGTILPMTRVDADFYALRSRRAASQSPAEAQTSPNTVIEACGGKASS